MKTDEEIQKEYPNIDYNIQVSISLYDNNESIDYIKDTVSVEELHAYLSEKLISLNSIHTLTFCYQKMKQTVDSKEIIGKIFNI